MVFEDIGKFAGATSYLHVAFHLDLGDIENHIQMYGQEVVRIMKLVSDHDLTSYKPQAYTPSVPLMDLLQGHQQAHQHILAQALAKEKFFYADLDRLRNLFPHLEEDGTGTRPKRFIGIFQGVLGTFMGIYTQKQIRALERSVSDLYERTTHLIDVTNKHSLQITEVQNTVQDLAAYLKVMTIQNPALTLSDLGMVEHNISRSLEIARNTFQMAQFRRLSIDFLQPEHLQALFKEIQAHAAREKATLIPNKPSDLFQLELSYIFNGQQATLLLHVPMVPQGALLDLYRLHSFPLVYGDVAFLPKPEYDVIALTTGFDRLSVEIKYSDLMDCQHNNRFFICERHGILRRNLSSTCLGALYGQNWEDALSRCRMEVGTHDEAVIHLGHEKYLVYTPEPRTIFTTCRGSSSEEGIKNSDIHLVTGIQEIKIQPGCTAQLRDHHIITDTAMEITPDIVHYTWNFQGLAQHITSTDIHEALAFMDNNIRFDKLTLADLFQNVHDRKSSLSTILTYVALSIAAFLLICFGLVSFFGLRVRDPIRTILRHLLAEVRSAATKKISDAEAPRLS